MYISCLFDFNLAPTFSKTKCILFEAKLFNDELFGSCICSVPAGHLVLFGFGLVVNCCFGG